MKIIQTASMREVIEAAIAYLRITSASLYTEGHEGLMNLGLRPPQDSPPSLP